MCSSSTAAFFLGGWEWGEVVVTAGTAAQTLLGSSTMRLAENKVGSFTFSLGRKFCLGLAQPIPAALREEEVCGDSFISNECQTYSLSRRGFEREKAKNLFSTRRHLFTGCRGCSQRPSCASHRQGSSFGGYSCSCFSLFPRAGGSLLGSPCNRGD